MKQVLGDIAGIKIGEQSHIKDNVAINCDYNLPTLIGNNTVIGSATERC